MRKASVFCMAMMAIPVTMRGRAADALSTTSTPARQDVPLTHRDTYDRQAWERGFQSAQREACYELPGNFPTDLLGTFFKNGHAKFKVGSEDVIHPFDADGMVSAVTFDQGRAWFRNRFVRTPGYLREVEENRICYRGVFGTAKNKGAWYSNIFDVQFKNVANTHVLYNHGRLYALWEAGLPFELDPVTLETIGESNLDGSLDGHKAYAAHYKIDPRTGHVCNFCIDPGRQDPLASHTLVVMEHDRQGQLLYKKSFDFDSFGFRHDMAITDNYFVFVTLSGQLRPLRFLLGLASASSCIELDVNAKTCRLTLIPRGSDKQAPIHIDIPQSFAFHMANAYEDVDGTLVFDYIKAERVEANMFASDGYPERPIWETFDFEKEGVSYQLCRIRVDPATRKFLSSTILSADAGRTVDFPVLHPQFVGQPYRHVFCAATSSCIRNGAVQGLAKINVELGQTVDKWLPEPHQFLSEVSFCSRSSKQDDDGYLVGYLLDGKLGRSSVVVFDAQQVGKGPIVEAPLQDLIPHALHGTFVPGFTPHFPKN